MSRITFLLSLLAALSAAGTIYAQDTEPETPAAQGDSQQVEESDEAFRRRMELEDARYRDPTYVDPADGYKRELEKIDRLPEASRDHIREQLIDVIMENGEWTPEDARREYPYTPSVAAQDDPALAGREQEAWDEQIEKYHAREAAAFGAYRGPAPGPGNPDGAQGGSEGGAGSNGAGGEGQSGQEGAPGAAGQEGGAAGTYQPYQPNRQTDEEGVSNAGVSESALDFILGRGSARGANQPAADPASAESTAADAGTGIAVETDTMQSREADEPTAQDRRGILAIEDLDKLGDSVRPAPQPREEEEPTPDDG